MARRGVTEPGGQGEPPRPGPAGFAKGLPVGGSSGGRREPGAGRTVPELSVFTRMLQGSKGEIINYLSKISGNFPLNVIDFNYFLVKLY